MSQLNRNYAYIRDVEGETTWEKLRVIRGFLNDRKIALAMCEMEEEDFIKNINEKTSYEVSEFNIKKDFRKSIIEDCKREIEFLKTYEQELQTLAYQSRIQDKTDEEMYELNFVYESKLRLLNKAKAEIIALGHLNPSTLEIIFKEPELIKELVKINLLSEQAMNIIDSSNTLLLN